MNIYKILQIFIIPLFLYLLFGISDISLFDSYLCDSGSINEIVYNNDNNDNGDNGDNTVTRDLVRLHFLDRVRRKLSWYVKGKNSDRFNSYDEFKSSWNPKSKVWSEIKSFIKEDIKQSRADAFKSEQTSRERAENTMFQIREGRRLRYQEKLIRFNERNNK